MEDSGLVKKVILHYKFIKVYWNSGIREKYWIRRYIIGFISAWTPFKNRFLPEVKWWNELSNGHVMPKTYLYGHNDSLIKGDDIEPYAKWSWNDYYKSGMYERIMFVHNFLDYLMKHRWVPPKYTDDFLRTEYQRMINHGITAHKHDKTHYSVGAHYGKKGKPEDAIIRHFMPWDIMGKYILYRMYNKSRMRSKFYKAIYSIINSNWAKWRIKKRKIKKRVKYTDFSIMSIMKFTKPPRSSRRRMDFYKIKPVSLYRLIMRDNGFGGKSFYDFDPWLGEKSLAASLEGCKCYYRPTCPFDVCQKPMADFLNMEFHEDDGLQKYGFTIIDNNFASDNNDYLTMHILNEVKKRVEVLILYIRNNRYKYIMEFCKPYKVMNVRLSQYQRSNGKFLFIR